MSLINENNDKEALIIKEEIMESNSINQSENLSVPLIPGSEKEENNNIITLNVYYPNDKQMKKLSGYIINK